MRSRPCLLSYKRGWQTAMKHLVVHLPLIRIRGDHLPFHVLTTQLLKVPRLPVTKFRMKLFLKQMWMQVTKMRTKKKLKRWTRMTKSNSRLNFIPNLSNNSRQTRSICGSSTCPTTFYVALRMNSWTSQSRSQAASRTRKAKSCDISKLMATLIQWLGKRSIPRYWS